MWPRVLLFPIAFSVLILNAAPLKADEWPKDYIVREDSESPDGLQAAYDDSLAKHMIVGANDKQVPENFAGNIFRSEEEKFDALDERLNQVDHAVRSLLPPNRFAKVKQEQLAWVKTRDAAKSVEEKSKLTEDRIKGLQDLLW